eukprot:scaffold25082_cov19-Tisochrysis_lutea.AAC.5
MGSSSDAPPEEERLHEQGAGSRLQGLQRGVWQGIQEAKCSGTACVRKLVELVQVRGSRGLRGQFVFLSLQREQYLYAALAQIL